MADRELREAPPQDLFDKMDIPEKPFSLEPAYRLGDVTFPSQFFASPRSRLTPVSGVFPCIYLGASRRTCVAEVWGDKFYPQAKSGRTNFGIGALDAAKSRFRKFDQLPALKICNVTDIDVREKLGIESGTFYAPSLVLPRTWAERVARHPKNFDGIFYRSRLTDEMCLVIWNRPGGRDIEPDLKFVDDGPFLDCAESYRLAASCGLKLAFP